MSHSLPFEELDESGEVVELSTSAESESSDTEGLTEMELAELELIPGMKIHTGLSGDILKDPITDPATSVYHGIRWNEDVQASEKELEESGILDKNQEGPVLFQLGLRIYEIPRSIYPVTTNTPLPELTSEEERELATVVTEWNAYVECRKQGRISHQGEAPYAGFTVERIGTLLNRLTELLDIVIPNRAI